MLLKVVIGMVKNALYGTIHEIIICRHRYRERLRRKKGKFPFSIVFIAVALT